jgi:hypothetical protein
MLRDGIANLIPILGLPSKSISIDFSYLVLSCHPYIRIPLYSIPFPFVSFKTSLRSLLISSLFFLFFSQRNLSAHLNTGMMHRPFLMLILGTSHTFQQK